MSLPVPAADKTALEIEKELLTKFSSYAPRCLKVQTIKGKLIPFRFNVVQELLDQIINITISAGRYCRFCILKARRKGISTYIEGRFYWLASTRENRYAATVTHDPDATDTLFGMMKRFHRHAPPDFKPKEKYNNKTLLEFEGLDSGCRVGTAGKEHFGSGMAIHFAHFSEVAKWAVHTQSSLLTSALQAIPDEPETEVYYESTALGIGGAFYVRYFSCRYRFTAYLDKGKPALKFEINENADPEDVYTSVFFPWFIFPAYRLKPPADFKRTEEEEKLVLLHGVDDEQLYWRRYIIANKCNAVNENLGKTKEQIFMQEYPSTPEEAFLASGRTVFDPIKVNTLKKFAPAPIARYDCLTSTGQWLSKADGCLRVWEEPVPGRAYVIGGDVAEGLIHGDFSCADVVEHLTGKQVAQWHGKVDPDLYAHILYWLGVRYNTAWLAVESNNHGISTLTELNKRRYPLLYVEMVPEPPNKLRKRYGWKTSKATKPLCIDNLVSILREDRHGIQCAETFGEMLTFVLKDDGSMEAQEGLHDDRVMSLAISHQVRRTLPLPAMQQTIHPGSMPQVVNKPPSPKGWT